MTADLLKEIANIVTQLVVLGVAVLGFMQWRLAQKTHVLVNKRFGESLKAVYTLEQARANVSGNQQDILAAALAKKELDEHNVQQAIVDKTSSPLQS